MDGNLLRSRFWVYLLTFLTGIAKPEAIFGLVILVGSYVYPYASGSSSLTTVSSTIKAVAYPFVWALSLWVVGNACRAALKTHKELVAEWKNAGESTSKEEPPLPSLRPSIFSTLLQLAIVVVPSLALSFGLFLHLRSSSSPETEAAQIAVYAEFANAHSAYMNRLGKPAGVVQPIRALRFHEHEHAVVLWLDTPATAFYVLQRQPEFYRRQFDPTIIDKDSDQFEELKHRRRKIRGIMTCGEPKQPPVGGILKMLEASPALWSWIGCLTWYGWFGTGHQTPRVAYQHFEKGGVIIGPLPRGQHRRNEHQVYVLFPRDVKSDKEFHGEWVVHDVTPYAEKTLTADR